MHTHAHVCTRTHTDIHFFKRVVASKSEEGQTNENVSRIKNGFQKIRFGNFPVLARGTIAVNKTS